MFALTLQFYLPQHTRSRLCSLNARHQLRECTETRLSFQNVTGGLSIPNLVCDSNPSVRKHQNFVHLFADKPFVSVVGFSPLSHREKCSSNDSASDFEMYWSRCRVQAGERVVFAGLMEVVAGIIHLGDMDFNQVGEKQCTVKTKNALANAARLLQVLYCTKKVFSFTAFHARFTTTTVKTGFFGQSFTFCPPPVPSCRGPMLPM